MRAVAVFLLVFLAWLAVLFVAVPFLIPLFDRVLPEGPPLGFLPVTVPGAAILLGLTLIPPPFLAWMVLRLMRRTERTDP